MAGQDALCKIAEWARDLPDEELSWAAGYLAREYRTRLRRASEPAALSLQPGDDVENLTGSGQLPQGARGRVVHLAGTRVHVDFGPYGTWAVLATAITKVAPAPAGTKSPAIEVRSTP